MADSIKKNKSGIKLMNLLKKQIKKIIHAVNRIGLNNLDFSIISDNCWGNFVYQDFGLEYQSPFVGLFIFSPDYILLLENLDARLKLDLQFIPAEKSKYKEQLIAWNNLGQYPIALLGSDCEIHFLHYHSEDEAKDKWNRRIKRLNFNNLLIKFCDRDLCTPELIKRFDELTFKNKLCLTAKPYPFKSVVVLSDEMGKNMVENEWKHYKKDVDIKRILNNLN